MTYMAALHVQRHRQYKMKPRRLPSHDDHCEAVLPILSKHSIQGYLTSLHAYYSELHEHPSDRRQISRPAADTSRLAQPARRTGPGLLPAPAAHRRHRRPASCAGSAASAACLSMTLPMGPGSGSPPWDGWSARTAPAAA